MQQCAQTSVLQALPYTIHVGRNGGNTGLIYATSAVYLEHERSEEHDMGREMYPVKGDIQTCGSHRAVTCRGQYHGDGLHSGSQ